MSDTAPTGRKWFEYSGYELEMLLLLEIPAESVEIAQILQ